MHFETVNRGICVSITRGRAAHTHAHTHTHTQRAMKLVMLLLQVPMRDNYKFEVCKLTELMLENVHGRHKLALKLQ